MAKDLNDMNLIDNFLFAALMSDETTAPVLGRTILKTIFQRDFQNLKVRSEHVILPGSEKLHGIRLDAFIEENRAELVPGGSEIYDVEPDKRRGMKQHLPRRCPMKMVPSPCFCIQEAKKEILPSLFGI